MSERIDEKGEVASFLNRVGTRLRDGTLATLGSNRAQGRLDTQNTAEELKKQFSRWAGQQGVPPTLANINAFLQDQFNYRLTVDQNDENPSDDQNYDDQDSNDDHADDQNFDQNDSEMSEPVDDSAPVEPQPGNQTEAPAAPNPTQQTNDQSDNPLIGLDDKATPQSKETVEQALLRLKTLLYNRRPEAGEAMKAIREIMSTAKASGAETKSAAREFIDRLRQDERITGRYPGIAQITDDQLDIFNENFERVTACASFLVENEISNPEDVKRIVEFFLTESNLNKKLTSVQMDRVFTGVARDMIKRNMVDFEYDEKQRRGKMDTTSRSDGDRSTPASSPSTPSKKFDTEYFAELLRDAKIDPRDIKRLTDAARYADGDMRTMEKRMGAITPELAKTVMSAALLSIKK